jgi:EmrB/QacA subfamily drug resistance transporter
VLVLAALDQTILSTALPSIQAELGRSVHLSWVFSAYLLASTVVIPLYGKLADTLGTKPLLVGAMALFFAGSLACGLSTSMEMLVLARAVQGLGGGGLMTLTMLGVVDLYPEEQRGRYMGLLGAAYGVSTMFGPLVGAFLVEHLSWHWAFFINVPVALAAVGILALAYPRGVPVRHRHAIDYLGAALLAGALITLLLATRSEGLPGVSPWALAAASAVLTLLFVAVEQRVAHPILPLSLFTRGVFSAATAISTISGVALFAAVVFLPLYLQTALHLSPTGSAWHVLPLMMGITLAAVGGGKALRSNGPVRGMALVAGGLMVVSFAALVAVLHLAPEQALALSACVFPLGLGLGLLFPLVTMVAQRSAPLPQMGIATATPIMLRALGGAVGVSLLGSLLTSEMNTRMPLALAAGDTAAYAHAMAGSLQPLYAAAAGVAVLAWLGAWLLPRRLPLTGAPGPR